MTHIIHDRRAQAMGGQSNDRSLSQITTIAWHYTAVPRANRAFITGHENFWRNNYGWDRGGYHFYIDADGQIWQNYDYNRITWGVANSNYFTVHISVEANSKTDYSAEQIAARDWLTRKIMADLNIPASNVKGHYEVFNNTACPGYSKAELDDFRAKLAKPAPVVSGAVVEAPKTAAPTPPAGVTSYPETGSFQAEDAILVRDQPSTAGAHVATYQKGEVLDPYHTVHIGNGYVWLQYNRSNGKQGYLPVRTYDGKTYGPFWGRIGEPGQFKQNTTVPAPKPIPKANSLAGIEKTYSETGTFLPNKTILVHNAPHTDAVHVATYQKGEAVKYHTVHWGNGHIWIQYLRGNGQSGYMPIRTFVKGVFGPLDGGFKEEAPAPKPQPKPVVKKAYVHLPKTEATWRVYPLSKAPIVGNEIGLLAPKTYGGLDYEILKDLGNNVVEIQTGAFGRVKIWVGDPARRYSK